MIRAVRPTDLVGLAIFLRQAPGSEITAHTWPKVQPESSHLPVQQAIWQSLGRGDVSGRAWVVVENGRIDGLAVARARCHGLVWDIEHLHVVEQSRGQAAELLDHVCQEAARRGARRVFLEVPSGADGSELAKRAGFERYTEAVVYRLNPPFRVDKVEGFQGRPRLRADEQAMFQLYNAAVPAVIRSAEAMTYEEWSALHRGKKRWTPSLIGDRHQYVWELGEGLAAWLEVVYGNKSQYLEFMVHPRYESMIDRFVAYALQQVSPKAAVYSAVREYQAALGSALERVGFKLEASHDIFVRQLAIRVLERKLVPANLIGG